MVHELWNQSTPSVNISIPQASPQKHASLQFFFWCPCSGFPGTGSFLIAGSPFCVIMLVKSLVCSENRGRSLTIGWILNEMSAHVCHSPISASNTSLYFSLITNEWWLMALQTYLNKQDKNVSKAHYDLKLWVCWVPVPNPWSHLGEGLSLSSHKALQSLRQVWDAIT